MTPLSDKEQVLDLIKGISSLPPFGAAPDTLEGAKRSLYSWLGRTGGTLQHPRVALFAGSHTGADKAQLDTAERYMNSLLAGEAALCEDIQALDADLRVYELDLKVPRPVGDTTRIRAAAYGMMAVEPGVDIMAVAGFGGASADAAVAFIEGLPKAGDPFDAIDSEVIAALAGAVIATRLANVPIILDGACAVAALMALCRINRGMADHCATTWQPPKDARQWFRENTKLQFMPSSGETEPGMEGAALIELALSMQA